MQPAKTYNGQVGGLADQRLPAIRREVLGDLLLALADGPADGARGSA